jgi:hypothetical protein
VRYTALAPDRFKISGKNDTERRALQLDAISDHLPSKPRGVPGENKRVPSNHCSLLSPPLSDFRLELPYLLLTPPQPLRGQPRRNSDCESGLRVSAKLSQALANPSPRGAGPALQRISSCASNCVAGHWSDHKHHGMRGVPPLIEALTALADALAKRPAEEILFEWFRSGRLVGELSVLLKRRHPEVQAEIDRVYQEHLAKFGKERRCNVD